MSKANTLVAALVLGTAVSTASAQQVGPLPDIPKGTIAVSLRTIATGLGAPCYGISPPGDPARLFVVEQKGLLLVVQNGVLQPTPALDIQSRVSPPHVTTNPNDERGLLGLAFHPGFDDPASPGYRTLYTYNSEPIPVGTAPTYLTPAADPLAPPVQNYKNVVNEWKMSAVDPNAVDPASRREVISFGKNAGNHNGGTITFGPDGYAYLALGDGGNANDVGVSHYEPGGNAQFLGTPLGKMLRFDPLLPALTPGSPDPISANGQYRIPLGNPFQGAGQAPEIYALGHRNPYRFSFDRLTGDCIVADVGQNNIEEIDREVLGGNYGWAVKEGDFLFNRSNGTLGARSPGAPASLIDPISGPLGSLEYDHSDGISITGGFVYRGAGIPELYGKYVFGDLAIRNQPVRFDGRLFYADLTSGEILEFRMPQFPNDTLGGNLTVHGFGQDEAGELYVMVTNTPSGGTGGIVYKMEALPATPTLVELFRAVPEAGGIRIEWRLSDPTALRSLSLQRGASSDGEWQSVAAPISSAGRTQVVLDADVTPGDAVWYRLDGAFVDGRAFTSAPLQAVAAADVATFALSPLAPNPSHGRTLLSFAVPSSARVRLTLTDVQGREVAVLADGMREAGRYTAALDASDLRAGLYFVRLLSRDVQLAQRLVVVK